MAYKALYRTYRPRTFEEVAGQTAIVKTLKNAINSNKIAHAFLFSGPRGTGKTTMARLIAKALNCEEGLGHQCNHCASCREIDESSHPDVIEIDAASNNGIEQVRDLIERVNYSPIEGRYKVYIIDEAHNMTDSAFNALLKTLEEPPSHVIFILATTEPHKILPTILSRCQRYDFSKVADDDIYTRLIEVLQNENVKYDSDAVKAIVALADGGMRDALSMLDQVLAYSNNELVEDDVYMLFGLASKKDKMDYLLSIHHGDIVSALTKLNAFIEGGVNLATLVSDLLEILKDIVVYAKHEDEELLTSLNEKEVEYMCSELPIGECNYFIEELLKTQNEISRVNNLKTLFELLTVRLCTYKEREAEKIAAKPQYSPQITPKIEENKKVENVEIKVEKPTPIPVSPAPQVVEETKPVIKPKVEEKPKEEPVKIKEAPSWLFDDVEDTTIKEKSDSTVLNHLDDNDIIAIMVNGNKEDRKKLEDKWIDLSSMITDAKYGAIAALLKDGSPYIVSKDILVLVYDFTKSADKVNIPSNQKTLSSVVAKMINRNLLVYAISRSESVRLRKVFFDLRQINQLPSAKDVTFDKSKIKGE